MTTDIGFLFRLVSLQAWSRWQGVAGVGVPELKKARW